LIFVVLFLAVAQPLKCGQIFMEPKGKPFNSDAGTAVFIVRKLFSFANPHSCRPV